MDLSVTVSLERKQKSPWLKGIHHVALVVDDIEKAKWFFGVVLEADIEVWRETQILIHIGDDLLVAKLSKDAVDQERQKGEFGKQVLDHYGFFAKDAEQVTHFALRLQKYGITIVKGPYDRADGRSVYFRDPFGNLVEYLFYKPS